MANKDLSEEQKLDNRTSEKIISELSKKPTANLEFSGASTSKRMRPDEFIETDKLVNELAGLLKIACHPDASITIKAARILLESLSQSQSTLRQTVKSSVSSDIVESSATNKSESTTTTTTECESRLMGVKQSKKQPSISKSLTVDEGEIRIQRSKFNLDDIPLPGVLMSNWKCKHDKNAIDVVGENIENKNMAKDELDKAFERASKALRLLYLNDQKRLQLQVNEIISSIQSITANPKTDSKLVSVGR